ncbi:hypothetical protein KDA_77150 [Dictyobacter alpinus]|uniref:Uncharacterized protein n=1 Tax=Dictyobacter alpinus TaxID=2014873 RepID=A0A402BLK4_9CHLR|nr:hypothetical protein [Dictyobacter alpinus]GCE32231.1 hypothetical protein KDA_77150 [Dictyobacter alpinus]
MKQEQKQPEIALHWMTTGYVSPKAQAWIEQVGGKVIDLRATGAPLIAVALAYNPAGAWTWSHGRREHRQGIEHWNTGEIQECSTGITLQYQSRSKERLLAEYESAHLTYLLLPDEEFDSANSKVKEEEEEPVTEAEQPQPEEEEAKDEHPF